MAASGSVVNPGFENNDGWVYSSNSDLTGDYYSGWSSEGSRSFQFYRNAGSTSISYYAQIAQSVDLTSVTGLLFDCQDKGIDAMKLQFLIDGALAGEYANNGHTDGGTSWGSTATVTDIPIDFAGLYPGVHDLTMRMQEIGSYSPADEKIYRIDNIRAVPEPGTLLSGMLGCLVCVGYRSIRKS